jgi:hypothetical protein
MSFVVGFVLGLVAGGVASWIVHDPDGARQLWADLQKMIGR